MGTAYFTLHTIAENKTNESCEKVLFTLRKSTIELLSVISSSSKYALFVSWSYFALGCKELQPAFQQRLSGKPCQGFKDSWIASGCRLERQLRRPIYMRNLYQFRCHDYSFPWNCGNDYAESIVLSKTLKFPIICTTFLQEKFAKQFTKKLR